MSALATALRNVFACSIFAVIVIVPLAVALFFTAIAYLISGSATYVGPFADITRYLLSSAAKYHWIFFMFIALAIFAWVVFAFILRSVFTPNNRNQPDLG